MKVLELKDVAASPWGEVLLQDINLSLEAGEILGIIGPNGAGKSSLLKVISQDLAMSGGSMALLGRPMRQWHPRERACRLAVLPQFSQLNFAYTVTEVVRLGRIPHDTGRVIDDEIVEEVLAAVDMGQWRHRLYPELSGGERQRVQLARVLAQVWRGEQRLLLLDEPTSALDLSHQKQVLDTIAVLAASGCAIIMVIHDFNLLAAHADRLLALHQGRAAACGSPTDILTRELFRDIFQADVHIGAHPDSGKPLVISA